MTVEIRCLTSSKMPDHIIIACGPGLFDDCDCHKNIKVNNHTRKLNILQSLMLQYFVKGTDNVQIYKCPLPRVLQYFELMENTKTRNQRTHYDKKRQNSSYCRDLSQILEDGMKIRHRGSCDNAIEAVYDSSKNMLNYEGTFYSLHGFVVMHYRVEKPDRIPKANAWKESEFLDTTDQVYKSLYSIIVDEA